jgi:hypothetical protein
MTVQVKLIEPAAYGRLALWEASDPNWPSIDAVQFRARDEGNGNVMTIARQRLRESERECSVD